MRIARALLTVSVMAMAVPAVAQDTVFLEDLTWTELRDAMRRGTTTVIIPSGGTEQSGPHLVLGKHNYVVRYTAAEIAKRLGNTVVAPVMAYVPEGNIDPPSSHMWAPGTITLPPEHFAKVVEFAARSLKQHGFQDIILLGDSTPNRAPMKAVAEALNKEWADSQTRVYHLETYSDLAFGEWLKTQGYSQTDIGNHAAIRDTSELMATHMAGVRVDKITATPPADGSRTGVSGNPTKASLEYGRKGIELKIDAAVTEIKALREKFRRP